MSLPCFDVTLFNLLWGITLNHDGDHYYLNCLYSFPTESKLKSHGIECKDYDYSHIVPYEEGKNTLKYNQEKNPWTLHSWYTPKQIHCLKKFINVITVQKNLPQQN